MSEERVEWGVRVTWPDGDPFIIRCDTEEDARGQALAAYRDGKNRPGVGHLIRRTVGEWEPVE